MKTTEVNKELVGRRCECMCLGSMVTGVIEDITVTKYTAEVKVRYDEPQRWGNESFAQRLGAWGQGRRIRLFEVPAPAPRICPTGL